MFLLLQLYVEPVLRPRILTPQSFVVCTCPLHFLLQLQKVFLFIILSFLYFISPGYFTPIKALYAFLPATGSPQRTLRLPLTLFHTPMTILGLTLTSGTLLRL